jgi:hypothetical protein
MLAVYLLDESTTLSLYEALAYLSHALRIGKPYER